MKGCILHCKPLEALQAAAAAAASSAAATYAVTALPLLLQPLPLPQQRPATTESQPDLSGPSVTIIRSTPPDMTRSWAHWLRHGIQDPPFRLLGHQLRTLTASHHAPRGWLPCPLQNVKKQGGKHPGIQGVLPRLAHRRITLDPRLLLHRLWISTASHHAPRGWPPCPLRSGNRQGG